MLAEVTRCILHWLVFLVSSTQSVHFLCINALLPYVLSTSFSIHPKPLTWDKMPFQRRRVPFSTFIDTMRRFPFFGTVRLKFLILFELFLLFTPSIFDILQQNGSSKISKVPPFTFFGTMRLTGNLKQSKKIIRKSFESFCCLQL